MQLKLDTITITKKINKLGLIIKKTTKKYYFS